MQGPTFDKNQELAEGYQDWCTTEKTAWGNNKVGELLADDVRIFGEDGNSLTSDEDQGTQKEKVLKALADLKETTIVDPLSVRVATTRERDISFGSDWEEMKVTNRRAYSSEEGWHHCIDQFTWVDVEEDGATVPKIIEIRVCIAHDH